MTDQDSPKPLYWEATYEIVLHLKQTYPTIHLDTVSIQRLLQMILALPNFIDEPSLANEGLLTQILREWYEEIM